MMLGYLSNKNALVQVINVSMNHMRCRKRCVYDMCVYTSKVIYIYIYLHHTHNNTYAILDLNTTEDVESRNPYIKNFFTLGNLISAVSLYLKIILNIH